MKILIVFVTMDYFAFLINNFLVVFGNFSYAKLALWDFFLHRKKTNLKTQPNVDLKFRAFQPLS
jgi:hypothetical protein